MEAFLQWTAWKMEAPPAYGSFHMTFSIIGLIIVIGGAWFLRNTNEKQNRIILFCVGAFLLITEVYKQLYHYYVICEHSIPWWIFPFQLCSVPMYLCLIAAFLKEGKMQKSIYNFLVYFNFLGGIATIALPHSILGEHVTITVHSLVWHLILIFLGCYLSFSGRAGISKQDYLSAVKTFLVLCCVAFALNVGLWDVSEGTVNNFFIGPANSTLIIFADIAETFGWYVSTALYIPTVCLGAFLIFLPFHFRARHVAKNAAPV